MNVGKQERSLNEEPFFFELGNDRLFAVLHLPATETARHGLVLCHALAEEKLWSHRVLVSLARELARRGMAVLRFDFRGEGDSDLDFEQTGIDSRIDDAVRAAEVLLERQPALAGVSFLGHRLGGAIAAAAAARLRARTLALVVWDPLPSGRDYVMSLLRANLAAQVVIEGKVTHTREELMRSLEAGETVLIDGYGIGAPLYPELVAMNWPGMLDRLDCPTLVVECEKAPRKAGLRPPAASGEARARLQRASAYELPFWHECKRLSLSAPNLTQVSVEWLQQELA